MVTASPGFPSGDPSNVDLAEHVIYNLKGKNIQNIVHVHDVWRENQGTMWEKLCILMDVASCTLRYCIQMQWEFSEDHWWDIMCGIGNGLYQAHMGNIVHGDLKPSNSSNLSIRY
jgi:serine/threonine protein kinase